jgi:hypothetical protein
MHVLSSNSKTQQWTEEEIAILKLGFTEGKRTKIIAGEIGRSETAVNKFLNRAGMRRKQPRQLIKTPSLKKPKILKTNNNANKKTHIAEVPADIGDVIKYVKSKGHKVLMISIKNRCYADDEKYLLNNKPTSAMKLLLLANRLRVEARLPIFSVASLIW